MPRRLASKQAPKRALASNTKPRRAALGKHTIVFRRVANGTFVEAFTTVRAVYRNNSGQFWMVLQGRKVPLSFNMWDDTAMFGASLEVGI